jgi:hypothetical protein
MKISTSLVCSLVAVLAAGSFAACSSVDPVAPQIGVDPASLDAGEEDACIGESNTELAAKGCTDGKNCGNVTVTDTCGVAREVSCGNCNSAASEVCNTQTNTCECRDTRSDSEIVSAACTAGSRNCGALTANDLCGKPRTGDCGSCDTAAGANCGGGGVCECTVGKYACGTTCVRNCLEGCATGPNSCEDTKRCVSACTSTSCAGKTTACTAYLSATGRSEVCTAVADGGACATVVPSCTTANDCGFTNARKNAVCVTGDGGAGECFYCGAANTNGLPCGGGQTCVAAARACQ